jgi:hypothetical protein
MENELRTRINKPQKGLAENNTKTPSPVLQWPPDSIRKPESQKRKIDLRKASHTRKLDP